MALIAQLFVNEYPIGWIAAVRKTGPGQPADDDVNAYSVQSDIHGETTRSIVEHRYGDGAAVLLAKASAAVGGV